MHHQAFKEFFEKNLNTQQQQAVMQTKGSLLIIAGAGSGKTRVITSRIINLIINENTSPHSIVALTFTNKAALEMKERIAHFLGNISQNLYWHLSFILFIFTRTYSHLTNLNNSPFLIQMINNNCSINY